MANSACSGMQIKVINSNVMYTDRQPAPIVITAAGPSSSGKHAGSLYDLSGTSPPSVPITVENNASYTFTAGTTEGSEGWASGSLTIQCPYNSSTSLNNGTPQSITVGYSGAPDTIHSDGCTGSATEATYQSTNFTVTSSGSKGQYGGCVVTFTVMNGGTAGGTTSTSGSTSTTSGSTSTT